jgi:hypothetical protein
MYACNAPGLHPTATARSLIQRRTDDNARPLLASPPCAH